MSAYTVTTFLATHLAQKWWLSSITFLLDCILFFRKILLTLPLMLEEHGGHGLYLNLFPQRFTVLPLLMKDKIIVRAATRGPGPEKCVYFWTSFLKNDQCCHFSCDNSLAVSPTNRKVEFLSRIFNCNRAINFLPEAPGVRSHAEVSVCFCLANKATAVHAALPGMSPHRSFLPSCLAHPSSLPSSLPASLNTWRLRNALKKSLTAYDWVSQVISGI